MQTLTFTVGELQANCYFVIRDHRCVIIDPGDSADFLLEEISRRNLTVDAVVATHGHFDHVMAAGELQLALNTPFFISEKDAFLINRLEETAKHFLGYTPVIVKPQGLTPIHEIAARFPQYGLKIIQTPGHTPGSCCIYLPEEKTLFTGDTLFKDGIGRYDFSYSDKKQLFTSIQNLQRALPEETLIYPGHGDPSSLGEEHLGHS